jgi:tRNA 2-selenouridine synthase
MPEKRNRVEIDKFLELAGNIPVIDVRSQGEYKQGKIPGAINLPLFNDKQRAMVGTIYAHQGRAEAATAGIRMIAPELSGKLELALKIAETGELLLYCWRGGMRSDSMAWLFSAAEIQTFVLEGGYKAYRSHVLSALSQEKRYIILGGLTGSGKTSILGELNMLGEQVTDLEAIACHRGSAFGAFGQKEQPSSEYFANLLYNDLKYKNSDLPVWLEDESKNIGNVFMPEQFFIHMHNAPVIALMMPMEVRLPRLIEEYSRFPQEGILKSIQKISRRLGGEKSKNATAAVYNSDFKTAITIVLEYYDNAYRYGLSKRDRDKVVIIETDTDDIKANTQKIIDVAKSLML